jgi:hypothetical protein
MHEFKEKGGVLGGREERYDGFEGEPKNIGGAARAVPIPGTTSGTKKRDSAHGEFVTDDREVEPPMAVQNERARTGTAM